MAKVGCPRQYQSVEEVDKIIEEYFDEIGDDIPTVTGLALALNLSRRGLVDYKGRPEFTHSIKKAKQRVERFLERKLINGHQAAGIIFNLKNNYSWKDKQEVEHTGKMEVMQIVRPNGNSS